jgi:hypothetical protein
MSLMGAHMKTDSVQQIVIQIGKKASFKEIIDNLNGENTYLKSILIDYLDKLVQDCPQSSIVPISIRVLTG